MVWEVNLNVCSFWSCGKWCKSDHWLTMSSLLSRVVGNGNSILCLKWSWWHSIICHLVVMPYVPSPSQVWNHYYVTTVTSMGIMLLQFCFLHFCIIPLYWVYDWEDSRVTSGWYPSTAIMRLTRSIIWSITTGNLAVTWFCFCGTTHHFVIPFLVVWKTLLSHVIQDVMEVWKCASLYFSLEYFSNFKCTRSLLQQIWVNHGLQRVVTVC